MFLDLSHEGLLVWLFVLFHCHLLQVLTQKHNNHKCLPLHQKPKWLTHGLLTGIMENLSPESVILNCGNSFSLLHLILSACFEGRCTQWHPGKMLKQGQKSWRITINRIDHVDGTTVLNICATLLRWTAIGISIALDPRPYLLICETLDAGRVWKMMLDFLLCFSLIRFQPTDNLKKKVSGTSSIYQLKMNWINSPFFTGALSHEKVGVSEVISEGSFLFRFRR